jgi:hypothetical protein
MFRCDAVAATKTIAVGARSHTVSPCRRSADRASHATTRAIAMTTRVATGVFAPNATAK